MRPQENIFEHSLTFSLVLKYNILLLFILHLSVCSFQNSTKIEMYQVLIYALCGTPIEAPTTQ